jgi:FkbM family methyltransferase
MPDLLPYGLRKIWSHPANHAPGGLRALVRCLDRSGAWACYQLQKQLGLFPAQGRVIPWIDGLRVHLLSSSQLSQACLYYGLPDWPSMQVLRRYLRPGDLCADIGANVGIYSLLLARHAGPTNVHAFECLPSNIVKLHANLRLNGFDGAPGVVVRSIALADRDGPMLLNASDGDATASISPPLNPGQNTAQNGEVWVQARRLDGYTWPKPLAYIKIDVEGAEQLVLEGSEQLLRSNPPRVWSFEYLDTQQRLGSSKVELLEAFGRWGYLFFLYQAAENTLTPFTPTTTGQWPAQQDDNVLAIHHASTRFVANRLAGIS